MIVKGRAIALPFCMEPSEIWIPARKCRGDEMSDPQFFATTAPLSLADVIALSQAAAPTAVDLQRLFYKVAALDQAGPQALCYWSREIGAESLARTKAGACFVMPDAVALVPPGTISLIIPDPVLAFVGIAAALHPSGGRPASLFANHGLSPAAFIHGEARLEPGVTVDPGAVIGPKAEIGSGTIIGANSVIGPEVRIGRNCAIGAQVTIAFALVGNEVTISTGVRVGQDAPVQTGVPAVVARIAGLGRVIIQDRVEIGANSTIDRGGLRDTVIGEGSRIGNLVHIERDRTIARLSVI
jgi:UDP-3-O-[3-hydroxymyristoyl] glucosamine N-acyltransferase